MDRSGVAGIGYAQRSFRPPASTMKPGPQRWVFSPRARRTGPGLHLGIEIVDRLKGALLVNFGPQELSHGRQQLVENHPLDLKGVEEGRVIAERSRRFTRPVELNVHGFLLAP